MHMPFVIAVLAFLALALLAVLDHSASPEIDAKSPRAYLIRIARWTQE